MGVGVFNYSLSAPAEKVSFPTSRLEVHSEILNSPRYGPRGKEVQEPFRGISQQELDGISLCHDAEQLQL